MLHYLNRIIILTILVRVQVSWCKDRTKFTMFLLYQEPYVVKHNQLMGIIPEQVDIVKRKCPSVDIELRIVSWSPEEARTIVSSQNPMSILKRKENISSSNFIIGAWSYHHSDEESDQFLVYPLVHSPGVAVIVHRDSLALGVKLFKAMGDSMLFLYNGFLLAAFVGITVWLLERDKNPMFKKTLGSGIMNGIWFGVVTMTSVGYGDISPKTRLAKVLCIIFMLGSSLHLAALTSLYTERVDTDDINLKEVMISTVNGSRGMHVARQLKKFHSEENIVKTPSFYGAIDKLSKQVVEASIIDYNIASWCQEEVLANNLRFTRFLDKKFDLNIYIHRGNDDDVTDLVDCLEDNRHHREHVNEAYIRDVNFVVIDNMDISYAMKSFGITPILSLLTALGLVALLVSQLIVSRKKNHVQTGAIIEDDILGRNRSPPSLEALQFKLDQKLDNIRKEVVEEYKELIEHLSNCTMSDDISSEKPMGSDH